MKKQWVLVLECEGDDEISSDALGDDFSDVAAWAETRLSGHGLRVTATVSPSLTAAFLHQQSEQGGDTPYLEGHVEIPDWRIVDGSDELPPDLAGRGVIDLMEGGYGAVLTVRSPSGQATMIGMEFDAGAFKGYIYPSAPEGVEGLCDEPVVHFVSVNGEVRVASSYDQFGQTYRAGGDTEQSLPYDGEAVIATYRAQHEGASA